MNWLGFNPGVDEHKVTVCDFQIKSVQKFIGWIYWGRIVFCVYARSLVVLAYLNFYL